MFAAQCSAPSDEVTRSIIHLLRQVIKRCHSLPKLGLIIPAAQAFFPASCSSPLTDQDIHPKEKRTYWSVCNSLRYIHALSKAPPCCFFPDEKVPVFPSHAALIFRYSMRLLLSQVFLSCTKWFSHSLSCCGFLSGKPRGRQPKVPKHTVDSGGVINISDDSSSDFDGMDTDSNSSPDSLLDNDDVIFVNHTSCQTGREEWCEKIN